MAANAHLLQIKLCVLVLNGAIALGGVMLAKWAESFRRALAYGQALAAGVLLCAGLVHMLPSAAKQLGPVSSYPLANLFAGMAFCGLVVIEEFAVAIAKSGTKDAPVRDDSGGYIECPGDTPGGHASTPRLTRRASFGLPVPQISRHRSANRLLGTAWTVVKSPMKRPVSAKDSLLDVSQSEYKVIDCDCAFLEPEDHSHSHSQDESHNDGDAEHGHDSLALETKGMSLTKAACLFTALSFHSVVEGLGIGTAENENMILSISVAIFTHKGLAAFALGAALRQSRSLTSLRFTILACIFAAGTPLGIILGISLSNLGNGLAPGICQAMAAGTFLQVASMEMIPAALHTDVGSRWLRCFTVVFGFALFSLLAVWV